MSCVDHCCNLAQVNDTRPEDKPVEQKQDRYSFAITITKILTLTIKHHRPKCPVLQCYHCAPSIITNWPTWQLHHKSWKQVFWRVSHYLPHTNNSPPWGEGSLIVEMRNEFLKVKHTLWNLCLHSLQRAGGRDVCNSRAGNKTEVFSWVSSINIDVLVKVRHFKTLENLVS